MKRASVGVKRAKQPTRTALKKQADALFSKIVRSRGRCERCGGEQGLQTAHIFSRRYLNTRWDEENAVCLDGCHFYFTTRPLEWEDFCIEKMGEEAYRALRVRALTIDKVDLPAVLDRLRERAGELGIDLKPKSLT